MYLCIYVADSELGRAKLLCVIEEDKFGVQKAILEGGRDRKGRETGASKILGLHVSEKPVERQCNGKAF